MEKAIEKTSKADKEATTLAGMIIDWMIHEDAMSTAIDKRDGAAYAVIKNKNGAIGSLRVGSSAFNKYASYIAWSCLGTTTSPQVRSAVAETIEAMARFEDCNFRDVYLRTAFVDDVLWYDLGDGRAVKVTGEGWEVVTNTEILFHHFPHQLFQVEPQRGGSIELLKPYLNLNTREPEKAWILLRTYIVAVLFPDISRPIQVLHGQKGSAKSTFHRVLKSLIDPSNIDLLMYPKKQADFVQLLAHHYLIFFDNLSHLTEEQSDDLCRACTGLAFSKRVLYTDDDDKIYQFRRAIGINGINLVSSKPDLLDRCLILELDPILNNGRLHEKKMWARFEAEKPLILGAIFDTISKSIKLKIEKAVVLAQHPRLADYAEWCAIINVALGGTVDEFAEAYDFNVGQQISEAIENSTLAQILMSYMEFRSDTQDSTTGLYELLKGHAESVMGIKPGDGDFPKSPRMLYKKMQIIKADLQAIGISFRYLKTERPRQLIITNEANVKVIPTTHVLTGVEDL
jgi:hypothetical protein